MGEESSRRPTVIRLAIVVEGETEEEFVKSVLVCHLRAYDVEATPHLIRGHITVGRLASEMATLYWSYDRVTSLVDFYGFDDKMKEESREDLETRVHDQVDRNISRSWDRSRVFPYVQQYEFEGLLFSDVSAFGELLHGPPDLVTKLQNIRSIFSTPEEINDHKATCPGTRIKDFAPSYQKRVDGPFLAGRIGLPKIRAQCPRFDRWIARLESLDSPGKGRPASGPADAT